MCFTAHVQVQLFHGFCQEQKVQLILSNWQHFSNVYLYICILEVLPEGKMHSMCFCRMTDVLLTEPP